MEGKSVKLVIVLLAWCDPMGRRSNEKGRVKAKIKWKAMGKRKGGEK